MIVRPVPGSVVGALLAAAARFVERPAVPADVFLAGRDVGRFREVGMASDSLGMRRAVSAARAR